jgi:hypothetical protein
VPDAIAALDHSRTTCEAIRFVYCQGLATIWFSQALILAGRLAEARRHAEESLALARTHRARGLEARALRLLGEVLASGDSADVAASQARYGEAIALAETLGLKPLISRSRVGLAAVYAKTGRRGMAREALTTAAAAFGRMEMTRWRERSERLLSELC